jgi:hypothetical protein
VFGGEFVERGAERSDPAGVGSAATAQTADLPIKP